MSFLNPGFLVAMALVAIPIIIHLLDRRRKQVHRFAAMEFILRSNRKTARRFRIKQLVLLLIRIACVAGAVFALSKPFLTGKASHMQIVGGPPSSVVIIIDNSRSMGFIDQRGRSLFHLAVDKAMQTLDNLGNEDNAAIITSVASGDTAVVPHLSYDRNGLRQALGSVQLSELSGNITNAIGVAGGLLQSSTLPAKRVLVFTDGTETSWKKGDVPWGPDSGPEVNLVDMAADVPLWNRAVVGARVSPALDQGPNTYRLDAEIRNYGNNVFQELPVTVAIQGRAVSTGFVDLEPNGSVSKTFFFSLPDEEKSDGDDSPRVYEGKVLLPPDPLPTDDSWPFVVNVQRRVNVLAINGEPSSIRRRDELFYLERALSPGTGTGQVGSDFRYTGIRPEELASADLSEVDVLIMANVERLTMAQLDDVESFVNRGGGLLITAGDLLNLNWYNTSLATLLPQPLRSVWAATSKASGAIQEPTHLAQPNPNSSLWSIFDGQGAEGLLAARFTKHLLLQPTSGNNREILLSFQGGLPAIVSRNVGKGRTMLFTSTIDRDWTDLPIRSAYLPLIQRMCRHLAFKTHHHGTRSIQVGDMALVSDLPPWIGERARIRSPDGSALTVPVRRSKTGERSVLVEAGVQSGFAQVESPADGRKATTVAVTPDTAESNLTRLPEPVLVALAKGHRARGPEEDEPGAKATSGSSLLEASPRRKMDMWPSVLILLVLLLLGESLLLVSGGQGKITIKP